LPGRAADRIPFVGMAAFRENEYQRLDYELLKSGPITSYFDRRVLAEDTRWLREHGYVVDAFDAGTWVGKDQALQELAKALEFPDYFGGNLDALNDCLSTLRIPIDSGRAVVLERFDRLYASERDWAWNLLDIFAVQSRTHLLFGGRLIVRLQSDDPRLSVAPVGANPVTWNRREWMNKNRGL